MRKAMMIFIVLVQIVFGNNPKLIKQLKYSETTEKKIDNYTISLYKDDGEFILHGIFKDQNLKIYYDSKENVKKYTVEVNGTTSTFERKNNTITSKGISEEIDNKPWYQMGNIRNTFINSDKSKEEFWFISSNFHEKMTEKKKIPLIRMVMKKEKKETIIINGKNIDTIHVRVTFPDFRSLFWHGDYWYRLSDGVMVRADEVRGAPGTPKTITILESEE